MLVVHLPLTEYTEALEIQKKIVKKRIAGRSPDVLLLLEHPPTITLGKRGTESHLLVSAEDLKSRGIALHSVDRGGEATYHGPGQIIGYPIMDLKRAGLSIRKYVYQLEETMIAALEEFEVRGFRRDGKVGVWTGDHDKIGSIGVRVLRRVTYHGFSLNVNLSVDPNPLMVSCGMPDIRIISLNDLLDHPTETLSAMDSVARSFARVFRVELEDTSLQSALE